MATVAKRYRVRAFFPTLPGGIAYQTVYVTGSNYAVALGAGIRAIRKLPDLKKRRITNFSVTVDVAAEVSEQPEVNAINLELPIPREE